MSPLFLATALLAVGCTTSQVLGVRDVRPVGIGREETIAVLLRQFPGKVSADFIAKETEIVSCMSDSIHKAHPALQILPSDEVRRAAFPDLAPEEMPLSPESLAVLVKDADLQDRMAQMHLRYLIVVEGNTKQNAEPAAYGIGHGGGGAGAFGVAWARRAHLSAVMVDLRENWQHEVTVTTTGRAFFGAVGVAGPGGGMALPLVVPAFPESVACSDLGEALAQWLAGPQTTQP